MYEERESSGEELSDIIKEEFGRHKIAKKTQVNYLSTLKSLLVENGALVNPLFEDAFTESHEALVEKFQSLSSGYAKKAFLEEVNRVVPLVEPYLRTDIEVDGRVISRTLGYDVKREAKQRQMDKSVIRISAPNIFLEETLAGLDEFDDPKKLCPALLLACGRRPATLRIPAHQVWDMTNLDPSDYQIRYTETVKTRGKHVTDVIPLLCSAARFMLSLEAFQEQYSHKATPSNIRQWCKWLKCDGKSVRPRDLRNIYGRYIQDKFAKSGKTNPANVARALMHSNIGLSALYMSVNFES